MNHSGSTEDANSTMKKETHRPTLEGFSLARVVDDVVRQLRLKKVPIKRWAAFVHVGI